MREYNGIISRLKRDFNLEQCYVTVYSLEPVIQLAFHAVWHCNVRDKKRYLALFVPTIPDIDKIELYKLVKTRISADLHMKRQYAWEDFFKACLSPEYHEHYRPQMSILSNALVKFYNNDKRLRDNFGNLATDLYGPFGW